MKDLNIIEYIRFIFAVSFNNIVSFFWKVLKTLFIVQLKTAFNIIKKWIAFIFYI